MQIPAETPEMTSDARRGAAGFTLVELIVTVSLAAILMAIGIPAYRETIARNRLTQQTNDIVAAMTLARSQAITLNQPVIFCRTADAESVVSPTCVNAVGNWTAWVVRTAGGVIIRRSEIPTFGGAITVKVTTCGTCVPTTLPIDQVTFASDGLARTSTNVLLNGQRINVCSNHSTTATANNQRRITLAAGSRMAITRLSGACP